MNKLSETLWWLCMLFGVEVVWRDYRITNWPSSYPTNDSIFIVVNSFSKISNFTPYHNIHNVVHIENLFFREVVRLNGLPKNIVFYYDTNFVGYFWWTLWTKLKIAFKFCSIHHPQHDG